jgi:hypothetical protein
MKIEKPKKKIKIGVLKRAVQAEFNHMIASGKPCAYCHQTFPVMQCSHIHSIGAYPSLRFDPMNALPMCGRHHRFFWHDEPGDAWEWFRANYPGRYEYLLKAKNKHITWTEEALLEVREKVKNKDIKGLLVMPELVLDK